MIEVRGLRKSFTARGTVIHAVDDVDFTAAEALGRIHARLTAQGIRVVLCEVVEEVRSELDRSDLTHRLGEDAFFSTPAEVMAAYAVRSQSTFC